LVLFLTGTGELYTFVSETTLRRKMSFVDILRAETRPTPKPAKKRPARNRSRLVEATWRMTPRLNIQQETIKDQRRPILSAIKGENRAPKNVPAERMETTADDCEGVMSRWPLLLTYPVEKRFCQ